MILIIGDTHLKENLSYSEYIADGRKSEKQDILNFLVSSAKDCDKVVFLGDCFNSKNPISSVTAEFVNFLERFGDKEIFLLAGNHDKLSSGKSSLDFLKEIKDKKWHVITNKVEQVEDLVFVPYFYPSELGCETPKEATIKVLEEIEKTTGRYLFLHHAISGSTFGYYGNTDMLYEVVLPNRKLTTKFETIFGGHIHSNQESGKVIIVGSTFTNEVGEVDKFIYKLDPETKKYKKTLIPSRGIYKRINPIISDFSDIDLHNIVRVLITKRGVLTEEVKETLKTFDAHVITEQYDEERTNKKQEEYGDMLNVPIEKLLEIYAKERSVDLEKLQKGYSLLC